MGREWNKRIRSREQIKDLIKNGERKGANRDKGKHATGFALMTGGKYISFSHCGDTGEVLLLYLFAKKGEIQGELPKTVTWDSWSLFQLLPEQQKILDGFKGLYLREIEELTTCCGQGVSIDYEGGRIPLPNSWTNTYLNRCRHEFHPGRSFKECEIAYLPDYVFDKILNIKEGKPITSLELPANLCSNGSGTSEGKGVDNIFSNVQSLLDQAIGTLRWNEIYNHSPNTQNKRGRDQVQGDCPVHGGDSHTSFVVNTKDKSWYCHACEIGGYPLDYLAFADGDSIPVKGKQWWERSKQLIEKAGLEFPKTGNFKDSVLTQAKYVQKDLIVPPSTKEELEKKLPGSLIEVINRQYVEKLSEEIMANPLVALKSPKGSGKTRWLEELVRELQIKNIHFGFLTHRQVLRQSAAEKTMTKELYGFNVKPRKDSNKKTSGSICWDSLQKLEEGILAGDWDGTWWFIEEAEAFSFHRLLSRTCTEKRGKLLRLYKRLLQRIYFTGGKVILMDADLSPETIEETRELMGIEPNNVSVVVNTYKQSQRICYVYNKQEEVLFKALASALEGNKILVLTSGQKPQSLYGAINLENCFRKAGFTSVVRIDSETIHTEEHPAKGCMYDLNNFVKQYQIVIASPAIETGVDLCDPYFDEVFGIFQGPQSVDAVCQALDRVRQDVPRHLYGSKTNNYGIIGNGGITWKEVLEGTNAKFDKNLSHLASADCHLIKEETETIPYTFTKRYGLLAAKQNRECRSYYESILSKLVSERYDVILISCAEREEVKAVKESIKQTREDGNKKRCKETSEARDLTKEEREELQDKDIMTWKERLEFAKAVVAEYYKIEVTPELVEQDGDGLFPHLQLYYYLTLGEEFLKARDWKKITPRDKKGHLLPLCKWDLSNRCLYHKVLLLKHLDILQFFWLQAPEDKRDFCNDDLTQWFEERIVPNISDIKLWLGVTVTETETRYISVANRILKKCFGLSMENIGYPGRRGEQVKLYKTVEWEFSEYLTILERWFEADKKKLEQELIAAEIAAEEKVQLEQVEGDEHESLVIKHLPILESWWEANRRKVDQQLIVLERGWKANRRQVEQELIAAEIAAEEKVPLEQVEGDEHESLVIKHLASLKSWWESDRRKVEQELIAAEIVAEEKVSLEQKRVEKEEHGSLVKKQDEDYLPPVEFDISFSQRSQTSPPKVKKESLVKEETNKAWVSEQAKNYIYLEKKSERLPLVQSDLFLPQEVPTQPPQKKLGVKQPVVNSKVWRPHLYFLEKIGWDEGIKWHCQSLRRCWKSVERFAISLSEIKQKEPVIQAIQLELISYFDKLKEVSTEIYKLIPTFSKKVPDLSVLKELTPLELITYSCFVRAKTNIRENKNYKTLTRALTKNLNELLTTMEGLKPDIYISELLYSFRAEFHFSLDSQVIEANPTYRSWV